MRGGVQPFPFGRGSLNIVRCLNNLVSTPNRLRGLMTSTYAFVLTATGMGIAPTLIALVTDRVFGDPARVGAALGWITGLSALASLPLLAIAARHYAARLQAARGVTES